MRDLRHRIATAVLGPAVPRHLSARVIAAVRHQEETSEILIGWVQLAATLFFAVLYGLSPKAFPPDVPFRPVPATLGAYALFTLLRLYLAYRHRLRPWLLALSVAVDMLVLMITIWSIHLQYGQPPALYLKAPTLLYVFIIIALRTLRFDPVWVALAGGFAALGWLALLVYAVHGHTMAHMVTHDFVEYMTSNKVLVGAEVDKIVSIVMVTGVLVLAITRGRRLMVQALADEAAVGELRRFFAPDVAQAIVGAEDEIKPGAGVLREAAAMFVDLRGFTALTGRLAPGELVKLLGEYQHIVAGVVDERHGSIITYLGDGVMITFGATRPSETYAAAALAAAEALIERLGAWGEARQGEGLPGPRIGIGVAAGTVTFGAIGDVTRLEYAVLGAPVNTAAKLQAHTRIRGTHALITATAWERALAQGFRPARPHQLLRDEAVRGLADPVTLVAMD